MRAIASLVFVCSLVLASGCGNRSQAAFREDGDSTADDFPELSVPDDPIPPEGGGDPAPRPNPTAIGEDNVPPFTNDGDGGDDDDEGDNPVPEPTTLILVGAGIVGGGFLLRRRKK